MITIDTEIPEVSACDASRCAYNINQSCHARAITIGDGANPMCDTYFNSGSHTRDASHVAGVGACKVGGCKYNDDFECQANSIQIEAPRGNALCSTFSS